jgi:23S rRNA A1618 N6-methylase RlmF
VNVVALAAMKTMMLFAVIGALVAGAGCVDTVSGGKTGGWPFLKDDVENRYERPVDQAFEAAKEVVKANGVLDSESILHSQTNQVKTVIGKVNQRDVYVRIEALNPQITSVKVQVRTSGGGADVDLAHQVASDITAKLASK